MEDVVIQFINRNVSAKEFTKFRVEMQKKHHVSFNNSQLRYVYKTMVARGIIKESKAFESVVKAKGVRELSGVTVFTILTTPFPETGDYLEGFVKGNEYDYRKVNPQTGELRQDFSCPFNCYYCPDESVLNGSDADMPRSYLKDEPAVARAYQNKFETVAQIRDRARSYVVNGIDIDKVEVIVEGGTYTSYPKHYRVKCMRDIFYAFNTMYDPNFVTDPREPLSIEEEIKLNEKATIRVIGITIETRPDSIKPEHIIEFRTCGITRIQIGLQHTDDDILKKINRQCTTADAIAAIKLMKECCFKIDGHLMPDLPFTTYDNDIKMFDRINTDPDLDLDQLKIYPCATVPFTVIKKWYESGKYKPYAEQIIEVEVNGVKKKSTPLIEALIHYKRNTPKRRRNNRIIRDIPTSYIVGGYDKPNLRQIVQDEMKRRGLRCPCIRCREVRDQKTDLAQSRLFVQEYTASGGTEFFISYENEAETVLYGFVRLRLSPDSGAGVFKELEGCALIRELHVYGKMTTVGAKEGGEDVGRVQHFGFGSKLMAEAERIAIERGYSKIAVIAGVGVRDYYRKKGYKDEGHYLVKQLTEERKEGQGASDVSTNLSVIVPLVVVVAVVATLLYSFSKKYHN
uniref:tRNA carboxymethyluridine synthase n=1 Tax=Arcella intermedia TaxID=1963864 RepID=A0A6B2KZC4_9EUKA